MCAWPVCQLPVVRSIRAGARRGGSPRRHHGFAWSRPQRHHPTRLGQPHPRSPGDCGTVRGRFVRRDRALDGWFRRNVAGSTVPAAVQPSRAHRRRRRAAVPHEGSRHHTPWDAFWDRYFGWELESSDDTVRISTDLAAVREDSAYGSTQNVYGLWPRLRCPVLLVRAGRPKTPGGGLVVSRADGERFATEARDAAVVDVDADHYSILLSPPAISHRLSLQPTMQAVAGADAGPTALYVSMWPRPAPPHTVSNQ
jgi:hypothetical protein